MKTFLNKQNEILLLIEKEDVDSILLPKLRGIRVDYVFVPTELKDNKNFLLQVSSCICIQEKYHGKILYYD